MTAYLQCNIYTIIQIELYNEQITSNFDESQDVIRPCAQSLHTMYRRGQVHKGARDLLSARPRAPVFSSLPLHSLLLDVGPRGKGDNLIVLYDQWRVWNRKSQTAQSSEQS